MRHISCSIILLSVIITALLLTSCANVNKVRQKISEAIATTSSTEPTSNNDTTTEQPPKISTRGIATVESMTPQLWGLDVVIKPERAKVNTTYLIQLYENGERRQEGILTWTQPEINVKATKLLRFTLREGEYDPYWQAAIANANWWKDIFSINIEEK